MSKMTPNYGTVLLTALVVLSMVMVLAPREAEAQVFPEIDIVTGGSVTLDVSPSGTGLGETFA